MLLFIFVFGLLIGSFLNVCIYRIPSGQSIAFPPSSCPQCGKRLTWYELIPVLSYVMQCGRCRKCSTSISIIYPLVELLTGILFVSSYLRYGYTVEFLTAAILVSIMIVAAFIDITHKIIPNKLVLFGLAVGIPLGLFRFDAGPIFILAGFAAGFIPMFLIAVISGGQMGFGDVKLAGVMGVFLGWKGVLVAILLAFFAGAVYGLFLMIVLGRGRKTAVPFGPFLAFSSVICYLWLDTIISWYFSIIL
ncbi:MAG TPA: prepilin peptidase [Desulfobacteria bacterium]|nr:prepilin peptidase [Desulfobacteria bacterium]